MGNSNTEDRMDSFTGAYMVTKLNREIMKIY